MKEMTEYLKKYMETVNERLTGYTSFKELEEIFSEHKDKISFMQHERIVHFLVTMMFALILSVFMTAALILENPMLLVLVVIIIVLLSFYIKHYYFLENTVQEMYRVYDRILEERRNVVRKEEQS